MQRITRNQRPRMRKRAAAGNRTRVTGLGSPCHNRWTTAARKDNEHLPLINRLCPELLDFFKESF
jgi:hypothetical protein